MKTDNKSGRIVYLDVLNVIAAIAVVFLHSTGNFHTFARNGAWITSCFAQCVFYWAVPVFLMCTGSTLFAYSKKYSTDVYFRKRFTKVVIPFLFWSAFFIAWKIHKGALTLSDRPVRDILNIFFTNQAAANYYFLFTIIGVYLTIPLLTPLAKRQYRKNLWYAVIVMFITQSVLPVFFQAWGVSYNNNITVLLNGYMLHVILGYLLSTQRVPFRARAAVYAAAFLSVLLRFMYTWKASFAAGEVDYLFSGYAQFHSVLSAAAVFLFVKSMFSRVTVPERVQNVLSTMAGCSFGVFLLHREILSILQRRVDPPGMSWQFRIFGALGVYLFTLGIVFLLKKIPGVRRLVP